MLLEAVAPCLARAPGGTIISRWHLGHNIGTLSIPWGLFFLEYWWNNFPGSTWQDIPGQIESLKSDKNEAIENYHQQGQTGEKRWRRLKFSGALLTWHSCQGHKTLVRSLSLKAWRALVAQGQGPASGCEREAGVHTNAWWEPETAEGPCEAYGLQSI